MQSDLKKSRKLKRKQVVSCDTNVSIYPVRCYFTRGLSEDQWHIWNTAPEVLTLRVGDMLTACIVSIDFDEMTSLPVQLLTDVTIQGLGETTCVLEQDIRFKDKSILDMNAVATQVAFVDMCSSKGIKCASFLAHYTRNPQDCELALGSQVVSLFVQTVKEMMTRRYDIMHHYPLFNRALGLYYSEKVSLKPPDLKDMVAPGGLLDRSAEDHQSLHGIPLVGVDHILFSHWNYPDNREEQERERQDGGQELRENHEEQKSTEMLTTLDELREIKSPCTLSPCLREDVSEIVTVKNVEAFNNLTGTLTDRPSTFPYIFTVHTRDNLTFDNLVDYCLKPTCDPVGPLPSRDMWGSVNPVLLMEDPVDPVTGKTVRRYTVTSRGHLSTIVENQDRRHSLCYNEVFLPGRPVSRLNLDVDLKCCQKCNEKFAIQAEHSLKRKVSEALANSLIMVIVESLLRFAKVKRSELESDPSLRELAKAVGKISVYVRVSSAKSKLSLRMLWYLPIELCSFDGIEAYRPLLDEMEKVSMNYVLLSYPASAKSCGLCNLGCAMTRGACHSPGSSYLRLNSDHEEKRCSSIDKAPYSFRKCVRLPNCYKEDTRFQYIDTFNTQDIEDPGFDDPLSLSIGLSSNPILGDVTSLGSRFQGILKTGGCSKPLGLSRLQGVPDQAHVESEARKLSLLWGVPVTIRKTGSGLFCVQANEKSTTYPCPIHNRVHSKSRLGALVFATHTKPKCFVS